MYANVCGTYTCLEKLISSKLNKPKLVLKTIFHQNEIRHQNIKTKYVCVCVCVCVSRAPNLKLTCYNKLRLLQTTHWSSLQSWSSNSCIFKLDSSILTSSKHYLQAWLSSSKHSSSSLRLDSLVFKQIRCLDPSSWSKPSTR